MPVPHAAAETAGASGTRRLHKPAPLSLPARMLFYLSLQFFLASDRRKIPKQTAQKAIASQNSSIPHRYNVFLNLSEVNARANDARSPTSTASPLTTASIWTK